jgi:formylglycine-generating enzyme required for sulfatase activity
MSTDRSLSESLWFEDINGGVWFWTLDWTSDDADDGSAGGGMARSREAAQAAMLQERKRLEACAQESARFRSED